MKADRRTRAASIGAALAIIAAAAAAQAGSAQATPPQAAQHTVSWITPADPTGPEPTDWDSAGHPQHLLSASGAVPDCLPKAAWIQIDHYVVTPQEADEYDELISGGVLTEVDGSPADAKFGAPGRYWSFEFVKVCVEATATPSGTPTATSTAPSETPTTDAPTTDAPVSSETPTTDVPTTDAPPSSTPEAAIPVAVGTSDIPANSIPADVTPVAAAPGEELAFTGARTQILTALALLLLAVGSLVTAAGRRPRRRH